LGLETFRLVLAFVVAGRCDPRVEGDVAPQVELVSDEVAIAQRLGLRGKMLAPFPLAQQLLGKRIAVRPAFGIEARAGLAIPVPGPADVAAGLEHAHRQAKRAQAMQLVHAGQTGTYDNRVAGSHPSSDIVPAVL